MYCVNITRPKKRKMLDELILAKWWDQRTLVDCYERLCLLIKSTTINSLRKWSYATSTYISLRKIIFCIVFIKWYFFILLVIPHPCLLRISPLQSISHYNMPPSLSSFLSRYFNSFKLSGWRFISSLRVNKPQFLWFCSSGRGGLQKLRWSSHYGYVYRTFDFAMKF